MEGHFEFIYNGGELTITRKLRDEGNIHVFEAVRERGQRPTGRYELRYDHGKGRFASDISLSVGSGQLPAEHAARERCRTYAELFERRFKEHFYGPEREERPATRAPMRMNIDTYRIPPAPQRTPWSEEHILPWGE